MPTLTERTPSLGPQEVRLLERIQRSSRAVVSVRRDRALLAGFEPNALRLVLKGLADGGWLRRMERGVYAVAQVRGAETHTQLALVADWLEGEAYVVTGFFALAHWNLTGHPPTTVDVRLSRRKAGVRYGRSLFRFVYVPAARLPDAREVRVVGAHAPARIATAERALTDVLSGRYMIDVQTASDAFERGLRHGVLQRRRLAQAAREAPSAAARRLGWIAEHHGDPLAGPLAALVGNQGYVPLDPKHAVIGARRDAHWRLLENSQIRP